VGRERDPVHRHAHPVPGRERDPTQDDRVGLVAQRSKIDPGYPDAQHLGHLGMRERGADTAANAAPKGSQE